MGMERRLDITFAGNLDNLALPHLLNQARAFILPSFYEGHPKALLEAMSCGLVCIGTNVEGIREEIRHGESGYLCDTDPQSIAGAIETVLSTEPEACSRIGEAARQHVVGNYSVERVLEMELDVLRSVHSRGQASTTSMHP